MRGGRWVPRHSSSSDEGSIPDAVSYASQLRGRDRKYRNHAGEFTQITPCATGNASIGGLKRPHKYLVVGIQYPAHTPFNKLRTLSQAWRTGNTSISRDSQGTGDGVPTGFGILGRSVQIEAKTVSNPVGGCSGMEGRRGRPGNHGMQ